MKIKDFLHNRDYQDKFVLQKIIEFVSKLNFEEQFLNLDLELNPKQAELIKKMYLKYEKEKIPLEYILGEVEFTGNKFFVNENVLIPRPETEYLIKYAKDFLATQKKNWHILDVGTGSGIIAISIALNFDYPVYAIDISQKALKVAQANAKKFNLKNVKFINSNLLESLKIETENILILANLPYVDLNYQLDDYAKKEPALALFAENEGLALYEKLLEQIFEKFKTKKLVAFWEMTDKQAKILNDKFNLNANVLPTCHTNIKILNFELK